MLVLLLVDQKGLNFSLSPSSVCLSVSMNFPRTRLKFYDRILTFIIVCIRINRTSLTRESSAPLLASLLFIITLSQNVVGNSTHSIRQMAKDSSILFILVSLLISLVISFPVDKSVSSVLSAKSVLSISIHSKFIYKKLLLLIDGIIKSSQ